MPARGSVSPVSHRTQTEKQKIAENGSVQFTSNFLHLVSNHAFFMSICYDSCKDIPAEEEQHMEEKNSNEKRQKKKSRQKRRYSRIGCYCFAIKKMWKLDRGFVFLIFAAFLPEVLRSLVADYFPGHLIDQISAGTAFRQLLSA